MSLISVRLPEDLDAQLARESTLTRRPKSEVAREAIAQYLARQERQRFLGAIARAALATRDEALAIAEEALPLDNEALEIAEGRRVREPRARYVRPRKKR
jgi:predicted transcriptional regulator